MSYGIANPWGIEVCLDRSEACSWVDMRRVNLSKRPNSRLSIRQTKWLNGLHYRIGILKAFQRWRCPPTNQNFYLFFCTFQGIPTPICCPEFDYCE
jgi:hypothetical protein